MKAVLLVGAIFVLIPAYRSEALTLFSQLQFVDHIRFACSLTKASHKATLSENEFCDLARSSLEDLAAGKLDSAVLEAEPYWGSILDPQAGVDKCRAQSIGPNGSVAAGVCDRDGFELTNKDQPLPLVATNLTDAAREDQTSLTIVVKGNAKSSGTATLGITIQIIEPSMTNPSLQQYKIEVKRNVRVRNTRDVEKALHERFQVFWASYFGPFSINEIRAHAIIKAKQDSERRRLP